jgi:hypothetical protein
MAAPAAGLAQLRARLGLDSTPPAVELPPDLVINGDLVRCTRVLGAQTPTLRQPGRPGCRCCRATPAMLCEPAARAPGWR